MRPLFQGPINYMRKSSFSSLGCFLLFGGLGFAVIGAVVCIRELTTEWIDAPGVVTQYDTIKMRYSLYKPCIHYKYSVDGEEVAGRDCAFQYRLFRSRQQAIEIAKADYDGEIIIWYDKKNPSNSRVQASRIRTWLSAMLGGATAVGLGVFILLHAKKQRLLPEMPR